MAGHTSWRGPFSPPCTKPEHLCAEDSYNQAAIARTLELDLNLKKQQQKNPSNQPLRAVQRGGGIAYLDVEAEHGEHGETAILDLLNLELGKGIRVVSKAERVERLARVEGVKALAKGTTVDTVGFSTTHEDHLHH
jgi:hypothetical protein